MFLTLKSKQHIVHSIHLMGFPRTGSTLMLLNQRGTRMLMMMPLDLMIGQMVYVDSANCNLLLFIFTRASTFVAPAFQRTVGTRLL